MRRRPAKQTAASIAGQGQLLLGAHEMPVLYHDGQVFSSSDLDSGSPIRCALVGAGDFGSCLLVPPTPPACVLSLAWGLLR